MATFDKKGLFHSDLAKAEEVTVTITCDGPVKSKFKGKADFISFKCEDGEHFYSIENEACGEALTGLKGETVTIKASGRDADAMIEVFAAEEQPKRPPAKAPAKQQTQQTQPTRTAPVKNNPAAPHTPDSELKAYNQMRRLVAQTALTMENCLMATRAAFHRAFKVKDSDEARAAFDGNYMEDIRASANTVFIEAKGMISFPNLPTKAPDPGSKPPPPPPEPEPEPAVDDIDLAPSDLDF
jgi:hypothetical protein